MTRFILIVLLFLTACNTADRAAIATADSATGTTGDTDEVTKPGPLDGCYAYSVARDTATLKLSTRGDSVTGILRYQLYEKDSNSGTIKGVKRDSLLVADYTFKSEGMTSVREVVFKIKGLVLVEGFGRTYVKGDTARFENLEGLQFQNERAFKKVNCD